MAAMQACYKRLILINGVRLISKNSAFHQSCRKRHFLASVILKNTQSKLLIHSNLKLVYRLASTNAELNETSGTISEVSRINTESIAINDTANLTSEVGTKVNLNIIDESTLPPIPTVVDPNSSVTDVIASTLKEPTFESLGLCSWWPSGFIQSLLEFLHINMDLPWWGAIGIVTVVLRLCVIQLNVKAKRNAIAMNNYLPELSALQWKLTEARHTGNYYDAALRSHELMTFMKEKNFSHFGSLLPGLVQAPIFVSMYSALKGMVGVPVESLKEGGLFWFKDLTLCDPYYILPLSISASLWAMIEFGSDGVSVTSLQQHWIKYCFRGIPVLVLVFTINFPAATLCYLAVSNAFSLAFVMSCKIPAVKTFFKFPPVIKHDPNLIRTGKKGLDGIKDSITNFKISKELHDRERLNTITFEKAGTAPIQRTFKKDPTRVKEKTAVELSGKQSS